MNQIKLLKYKRNIHLQLKLLESCNFLGQILNIDVSKNKIIYFYPITEGTPLDNSTVFITGYLFGNRWIQYNKDTHKDMFEQEWIYCCNFKINLEDCKSISILEEDSHPLGQSKIQNLKEILSKEERFIKVGSDCIIRHGDGGYNILKYPVYYCKRLNFEKNDRLVHQLEFCAYKFNDWNSNGIVQDIIDPDRYPEYFKSLECARNNRLELLKEPLEHIDDQAYRYNKYLEMPFIKKEYEEFFDSNNNDPNNIRWKYHWKPVVFKIFENSAEIINEIPGIPLKDKNKDFYFNIEQLFGRMIPAIRKIVDFNSELQVIIKAQKYVIKPGITYTGKWHVEGVTERIVANGVYYCKVDDALGGSLQFKNKIIPGTRGTDLFINEVEIEEGTCVVFNNDMIHRFTEIRNETDEDITRLFINFFIIDPTNKLPLGDKEKYHEYSETVIRTRELVRKELSKAKNNWEPICYGNCGEIRFVNFDILPNEMKEKYKNSRYDNSFDD